MSSYEEIRPRELKPALLELDGISRASVEAHYKLYQGYVNKRNEILGKLAEVDLASANQVYSEIRALKVDLTFAIGGIKNHEIYFEHLGGHGGSPDGAFAQLVRVDEHLDENDQNQWQATLEGVYKPEAARPAMPVAFRSLRQASAEPKSRLIRSATAPVGSPPAPPRCSK